MYLFYFLATSDSWHVMYSAEVQSCLLQSEFYETTLLQTIFTSIIVAGFGV